MFYYRFPAPILFKIEGPHAERYLQARLCNDMRLCSEEKSLQAAALTAQGKVDALFRVWKDGAGFMLCCDGGDPGAIQAALLKFKVADQLECTELSNDYTVVYIDSPTEKLLSVLGVKDAEHGRVERVAYGWCMVTSRLSKGGLDFVISHEHESEMIATLESGGCLPFSSDQYQVHRVQAAVAAFPDDLQDRLLLEVDFPGAVSYRKGCYVGQEVMERMQALGKPPRSLIVGQVEGLSPPVENERLTLTVEHEGESPVELPAGLVYGVPDPSLHRTLLVISCRNSGSTDGGSFYLNGRPFDFLSRMRGDLSNQ